MKILSHMNKKPRVAFLEIPPFGRNDCPQFRTFFSSKTTRREKSEIVKGVNI